MRFSPFAAAFTTRPSPPTRLHLTPGMRKALQEYRGWTDGQVCPVSPWSQERTQR